MSSENSDSSVCFRRSDFNLYLLVLFFIIVYFVVILLKSKEQQADNNLIDYLKHKLTEYENKTNGITQVSENGDTQDRQNGVTQVREDITINRAGRLYNPLIPPERIYPGGRLYDMRKDVDFQQVGIIYNNTTRLPLFGRPKYIGKSDKWEYYIIDESRNRLKIPYKSKNDNEIFDGDNINIFDETFTVKLYEYDQFRYDPNII